MHRNINYPQYQQQTGASPSQFGLSQYSQMNTLNQQMQNQQQQPFAQGNQQGGHSQINISPAQQQHLSQQIAQQNRQYGQVNMYGQQQQNPYSQQTGQQQGLQSPGYQLAPGSINPTHFQQQTGANLSEFAQKVPVNHAQFRQTTGHNLNLQGYGQMQEQQNQGMQQSYLNTAQFQQQTGANPSEFAQRVPVNHAQFRQTTGHNMNLQGSGQYLQNQNMQQGYTSPTQFQQ